MNDEGSVTLWPVALKAGDIAAAQRLRTVALKRALIRASWF